MSSNVADASSFSAEIGEAMHALARRLYPICRSITGEGVRQTLSAVQEMHPELVVHAVPSGTPVNDWTVPDEWNVADAYVADMSGNRVVDFREHNLHLVSYSEPVDTVVDRATLLDHLHTLPDQPDVIPYKTSYYQRTWGFCLQHKRLSTLGDPRYQVRIDATLQPGVLNYGELFLEGRTDREIIVSTHVCHPSLANDNLSGIALSAYLAQYLKERSDRRYSYRFLFLPGTIGAITWLAKNPDAARRAHGAFVVALVGAPGPFHYKQSPEGNAHIDRVVNRVLDTLDVEYVRRDFSPYGYDERQYTSPGYGIASGSLTRVPFGEFPEYHTSADDMQFVTASTLAESLGVYRAVFDELETETLFANTQPRGEPQLGRRGLYDNPSGALATADGRMAMLWLLNRSDGSHSLRDIAEQSGIEYELLERVASELLRAELLRAL